MQDAAFLSSRRFGGIARLYGDEALARFLRAHVCVVGVGGVGSWAVEALARSGIGRLTLIDLDNVAESNVNRQLHALTDDFGKAKVTALRERIAQINPQCEVTESKILLPKTIWTSFSDDLLTSLSTPLTKSVSKRRWRRISCNINNRLLSVAAREDRKIRL